MVVTSVKLLSSFPLMSRALNGNAPHERSEASRLAELIVTRKEAFILHAHVLLYMDTLALNLPTCAPHSCLQGTFALSL